ncbi:MAG: hypothetical protein F4X02_08365 [Chloroflexi bacterium]|nr:hypothetical protein [Chloroflexota bacterium]
MKRKADVSKQRPVRRNSVFVALFIVLLALVSGLALPYSGALDLIFSSAKPCTLADQIVASNTRKPVGGCPAGTGDDVVTLHDSITLTGSLPRITGTITVEGNGHTIDGKDKYQIFDVKGGTLHINNLIMTRGKAYEGGALELADNAVLVLSNSTISDSSATNGGAIHGVSSNIEVVRSSFVRNKASKNGGGIYLSNAKLHLSASTISHNRSKVGGGISSKMSKLTIMNSSVSHNRSDKGGALWSSNSKIEIYESALERNSVDLLGGAIASENSRLKVKLSALSFNESNTLGSAIYSGKDSKVHVENSTISQNSVYSSSGAVHVSRSLVQLIHVTAIGNSSAFGGAGVYKRSGQLTLINSIVTGNGYADCFATGGLDSNINNLITDGSCEPMLTGNPMLNATPGSPAYYKPRNSSPALDAANTDFCPSVDQRRRRRQKGSSCDLGAIESN